MKKGDVAVLRKVRRESFTEVLKEAGRASSFQGEELHIKCDKLGLKNLSTVAS